MKLFMWGLFCVLSAPSLVSAEDFDRKPFKLTMNKNKQLCTYMLDVLNKDVEQYGHGYDPGKFQDKLFRAIPWVEQGRKFDYYGQVARFDIDNDGKEDVVVREETSPHNVTTMSIFVFSLSQYPEAAMRRRDLEHASIGFIDTVGTFIHPFVFDRSTYLLITRSPDSSALPSYFRVTKYKGGRISPNALTKLDDVCVAE